MITLKGKYNFAHVFTDNVDNTTQSQIIEMLNQPAFKGTQIRIMPDCHAGKGSVIGFTAELTDYIIPNIVGVDIGCAVYSWNLGNKIKLDYDVLDNLIKEKIPSGFKIREKKYNKDLLLKHFIENKLLDYIDFLNLSKEKVINSIGSLGGGNHFIEFGKDDNDDIWLTIHSGSRNFGLQVCNYFQNKAVKLKDKMLITGIPKGLEYLPRDFGGNEYLEGMKIAQELAHFNRTTMGYEIIENLGAEVKDKVFSVHNYIDFEDNIIRKGAIKATEGTKVVIPFNMRDGLIIGTGKGSKKWNNSAPHGAGRIMSRRQAKENIDLKDFKNSMEGIYSSCVKRSTLDESPFVYKDKDEILENIKETVDVDLFVKTLYNFKGN